MIKYVILIISIIFLITCENKYIGFSKDKKGFYFKYYQIGEETKTVKYNDYIFANLVYKTINDSIFFKGQRRFQITPSEVDGGIEDCFLMMAKGDSADFIISASDFFEKSIKSKLPSFFKHDDDMKISIKLIDIMSEFEYNKQKQEFLSWIKDFAEYEQIKLKHYIEDECSTANPDISGIYRILKKKGNGKQVEAGDTLVIDYEGKFLSGKKFDSTIDRNSSFEFVYGTEWQVIKGLEKALAMMTEGEESVFIMPSYMAFGSQGSSTGIIPPFTSVIFEVKLKQIKKINFVESKYINKNN